MPAVVAFLGFDQRRAAGTSLLAIAPAALCGAISYGTEGKVNIFAAMLLAVGSVLGVQVGAKLLHALPTQVLPWVFVGFVAIVLAFSWTVVPQRDGEVELSLASGLALIGIGLASGLLSGLVGVGGGVVAVPGMELVLGSGDLLAKGTSLLMMLPTTLSGTLANLRGKNVDLVVGIVIGAAAACATPLGAIAAAKLSAIVASALFSVFLVSVAAVVVWRHYRSPQAPE